MNGQPKGFFTSSRGVKKGNSLSPTLFIVAIEVISKALNDLMKNKDFKRFKMTKGSPKINHIAFVDDIIILCKLEVRIM